MITKKVIPATTKTVVVTPETTEYHLVLNQEQLDAVVLLLGSIGDGSDPSFNLLYCKLEPSANNIEFGGDSKRGNVRLVRQAGERRLEIVG